MGPDALRNLEPISDRAMAEMTFSESVPRFPSSLLQSSLISPLLPMIAHTSLDTPLVSIQFPPNNSLYPFVVTARNSMIPPHL